MFAQRSRGSWFLLLGACCGAVMAAGCTQAPAPQFRLNLMELEAKQLSPEQAQKVSDSLLALFGTPDEVIASLQARVDAGVEYFFLHTMTPDPAQLQLWVDHIIPNVHFPASAGPVRRPPTPWRASAPAVAAG